MCTCFGTSEQDIDELMRAAAIGNEQYIRSILNSPSLLSAQDRFGQTAVHWASYRGQLDILRLLVEAGGSLTQKDNDGRVALHWAVRKDRTLCVRYILQRGSPLDIQTKGTGETALHKAVKQGNVVTCEMLLKAGAKRDIVTSHMQTALDIAEEMSALEQKFKREDEIAAEESQENANAESEGGTQDEEATDENKSLYATGEDGDPEVEEMDKFGPIVELLRNFDDSMVDKDDIYNDGNASDTSGRAKRKRELYQEGGPMAEVLEERLASGKVKSSRGCSIM